MKIKYKFNSFWVSDKYEDYDEEEFEYEIDDNELKTYVAESYADLIKNQDVNTVYDLLDELDYEEKLSWDKLIESYKTDIEIDFTKKAMEWYATQIDLGDEDER